MKIKSLASIPFEEVIGCFLKAFEDYFVKLPEDIEYWRGRFKIARVDWHLSFGIFDNEKLVGYVIHCIDRHNGKVTAYNTGTGVLPGYRGKAFVDKLYAHALPLLKAKGVEKCLLEVICENERAIRVYERIGFDIRRKIRTFSGSLPKNTSGEELQKWHFSEVFDHNLYKAAHYSWDNSAEAVRMAEDKFSAYFLGKEESPEAYLVIDREGNMIQLASRSGDYLKLLTAAGALANEVKLKNVDADRIPLINTLGKMHFSNPVNQYEMERSL